MGVTKNFATAIALSLALSFMPARPARAQLSSASVTGFVRDSSSAVVVGATVVLRNVDTAVERQSQSNSAGTYTFLNVPPGRYSLKASAAGFKMQSLSTFTLAVNQTASIDFSLQVGVLEQTIDVAEQAANIESATSELGTVVSQRQVADLPLNGRNFTQLLALTPGVTPVSVAQNAGGSFTPVTQGSTFTFPAINGQTNRSNFFMLDGLNNQGTFSNTYGVTPIIDAIQEFKVNSHNDQAQFGAITGGTVNVVTKSGTNEFHGTLWEYLRNDYFNARNTFQAAVTPFKQNQFGGSIGGPVLIPHIYHGRNKTFFFGAAEGFLYRQPVQTFFRVPTAAELSGDFSSTPTQIFNPFTTRPDPANPGRFVRDPFAGNRLPGSLIDARAVAFAKAALPAPIVIPGNPNNAINSGTRRQNQYNFTTRVDHNFGAKDFVWFRYSGLFLETIAPSNIPSLLSINGLPARNYGVSWVHTFSPSLVLQLQYGRTHAAQDPSKSEFQIRGLGTTYGFAPSIAGDYIGDAEVVPSLSVPGYWSGGQSSNPASSSTNIHQYKGDVSKIVGKHNFRFGGDWSGTGYDQYFRTATVGFATPQTGNPGNSSQPGNALASFLLSVPDNATRRNTHNTERPGGVLSFYVQDQWKVTSRLTMNIGLRFDRTFIPPYGSHDTIGQQGGPETGDMNFNDGTYIVQLLPPPCSERGHAPCIPGDGKLPAHVVVSPNGKILRDINNWGPRFGIAYRVAKGTAIRTGFGMVYDNWAAVTQIAQNYVGQWPDTGQTIVPNLNVPTAAQPLPVVTGQNPLGGFSVRFPPPTPFGTNTYFMDPNLKNPYSEQWNFAIEHQFNLNTSLSVAYVGSASHRLDVGGYYNTALVPGPGNPRDRAPFPYIIATLYDRSIGNGHYQGLQLHFQRRFSGGFASQLSYTFSKSIDTASSGWFSVEGQHLQDPYNVRGSRSISAYDIPHVLTINMNYELPVGKGKPFSAKNRMLDAIIGNWQTNAIFLARTGTPFTIMADGDIANTGNATAATGTGYMRANLVGDPYLDNRTTSRWFNTAAFAIPPIYTFGTLGRNTMRSESLWNLDVSVFRQFPIRDRGRLEFRGEAFNVFNTVIYGTPGFRVSQPDLFGRVTGTSNSPRSLQLGAKLIF